MIPTERVVVCTGRLVSSIVTLDLLVADQVVPEHWPLVIRAVPPSIGQPFRGAVSLKGKQIIKANTPPPKCQQQQQTTNNNNNNNNNNNRMI
jgi:hypothetical protein